MMGFRVVKDSIISNILIPNESGRFTTVDHQRQSTGASELEKREVTVYYQSGDFPKNSGRYTGPVAHDITYRIEFSVSKACEGDLDVLSNPDSTDIQRSAALSAFKLAADLADESLDELFEIVYQILMAANNVDMGLPVGTVSNRWISSLQKDSPLPQGEYIVLTGSATLDLRVVEQLTGISGANLAEFDNTNELKDDPNLNNGTIIRR